MGTDITFKGVGLRSTIPGIRITKITRPARPPRERNKVVVPGRDGSYDFGNNRKEDFLIYVEVVLEAKSASELQNKTEVLAGYLDGKGTLTFSDSNQVYRAQVYDELVLAGDATARWARGLVVFECDAAGE